MLGDNFGSKPPLSTNTDIGVHAPPVGGGPAIRVTACSKWTNTEVNGSFQPDSLPL